MPPCLLQGRVGAVVRFVLIYRQEADQALAATRHTRGRLRMTQPIASSPVLALSAGILVLLKPKLLNYIVAAYLISDGLLRLMERR